MRFSGLAQFSQRSRALDAAAHQLERPNYEGDSRVSGMFRGHAATFAVVKGCGWSVVLRTTPLALVVDVTTHSYRSRSQPAATTPFSAPFGERYDVDAAPAEAAEAIVTADMREQLLALKPDRLSITPGVVELAKRYVWFFAEADDIRAGLELAVAMAERAQEVAREIELRQTRAAVSADHPYREDYDREAACTALATRDNAINSAIDRYRKRRDMSVAVGRTVAAAYLGLFLVEVLIAVVTRLL